VNTALGALTFTPGEDYSGPTVIDIEVPDGPHFVNTQIPVTVEPAPPQIVLPSGLGVPSDVASPVPGIEVLSIDGDVDVSLSVDVGTTQPQNVSGPAATIGPALSGAQYTPPAGYLGGVMLVVGVTDGPHSVWEQTLIQVEEQAAPVPALGPLGLGLAAVLLSALGAGATLRRR